MILQYPEWLIVTYHLNVDHDMRDYRSEVILDTLLGKTFYWSIPNDDNRIFEGREIRERYLEISGSLPIDIEEVTVLEVILALAIRCEEATSDSKYAKPVHRWFWELVNNMFPHDVPTKQLDLSINRMIERTYSRDGVGGLFPLRNYIMDLREVELWYQMMYYLCEKYPI